MVSFFYRLRYSKLLFLNINTKYGLNIGLTGVLNVCDLIFVNNFNTSRCIELFDSISCLKVKQSFYLYKKLNICLFNFLFVKYFLSISNNFSENFFYCIIKLNIIEKDSSCTYFEVSFLKMLIYILFIRRYYGKYNSKLFNEK